MRVPNFNTLTLENSYFHSNSYDYSVSLITFLAYTLLIDILQRQGEGPPPCQHEVQQHVCVTTLCTSKHQPCYSTFLLHCLYNPIVIVWGTWGCITPPSPECARPQFTVKTSISPSEALISPSEASIFDELGMNKRPLCPNTLVHPSLHPSSWSQQHRSQCLRTDKHEKELYHLIKYMFGST